MTLEPGRNLEKFIEAGMLKPDGIDMLREDQRRAIESWDENSVDLIISKFRETGEFEPGIGCVWI